MRTDDKLDAKIRNQDSWEAKTQASQLEDPINQSFSGEERNRWYHGRANGNRRDMHEFSMLSGLDSISDGRAFAIADFNHDGRPDIALCNANAPHLQIFENQIDTGNNFVALRFEGAADVDSSASGRSCRDGYGAVVELTLDDGRILYREFRCGEGFAAQNSDTLMVGIGNAEKVKQLEVTWPSGTTRLHGSVPGGSLQILKEQNDQSEVVPIPYLTN